MPALKLSTQEWKEIRKASEAGCEDEQLSQDYGISKVAIRQRRWREKWLTPARVHAEVAAEKARLTALKQGNRGAVIQGDVTRITKPAEESIAARFLRDGETASLAAMAILLKKLQFAAEHPEEIDDLASVGDVATAVKTARSIAGMDKQEGGVQINLQGFFGGGSSQREERETKGFAV